MSLFFCILLLQLSFLDASFAQNLNKLSCGLARLVDRARDLVALIIQFFFDVHHRLALFVVHAWLQQDVDASKLLLGGVKILLDSSTTRPNIVNASRDHVNNLVSSAFRWRVLAEQLLNFLLVQQGKFEVACHLTYL